MPATQSGPSPFWLQPGSMHSRLGYWITLRQPPVTRWTSSSGLISAIVVMQRWDDLRSRGALDAQTVLQGRYN